MRSPALGTRVRPGLLTSSPAAGVLLVLFLALLCWQLAPEARADAVVTNNTPQDLAAALAQGGLVTFAQDGAITFTNTIAVSNQVTLDATGHTITLNGNNSVRLFTLLGGANVTLSGLTLTGGRSTNGGALYLNLNSTALLTNCTLSGNTAGTVLTSTVNVGHTNSQVLTNFSTSTVSTNYSTNYFFYDPYTGIPTTNSFTITSTVLQTTNILGVGITTPTNTANVTNTFIYTNTVTTNFTLVSTNFTLVTNIYSVFFFGTNTVVDTNTTTETDTSIVTNTVVPASRIIPAPGSDGNPGTSRDSGTGGNGGAGRPGQLCSGGAIFNRGSLSLLNCTLATNSATGGAGGNGGAGGSGGARGGNGGAGGKGNSGFGGAVYNEAHGSLFVTNCTFAQNTVTSGNGGTGGAAGTAPFVGLPGNGGASAPAGGGAIYNLGILYASSSTFSDNSANGGDSAAAGMAGSGQGNNGAAGGSGLGGAVYNAGPAAFNNCTLYANQANGGTGGDGGPAQYRAGHGGNGGTGAGGGLYTTHSASLLNCTIWQNSALGGSNGVAGTGNWPNSDGGPGASHGGGLARIAGKLQVANSIIGGNTPGHDAYGAITDKGYNIWSDKSIRPPRGNHSTNGVDANLKPFGNYGGPTFTLEPNVISGTNSTNASLAIDFITNLSVLPPTDQRGVSRPQGLAGDAGAVEYQAMPYLLSAPRSLTQTNGGNVTFTVSAAGAGLGYQWRFAGTNIATATTSAYSLTGVTPSNQGLYDVIITNSFGAITSTPTATLTVQVLPPSISTQPLSQNVAPGATVVLSVLAGGSLPLSYQWQFNNTNLANATNPALAVTTFTIANQGSYAVVLTNLGGAITSDTAVLTLGQAPAISAQPASQLFVPVGSNATFTVTAQGTPPLFYHWQLDGTNLPAGFGTNLTSYTIPSVQSTDAGSYTVLINNLFGSVTSAPALLTVVSTPIITAQPAGLTVFPGSNVTFAVSAAGSPPLNYQWRFNGTNLSGALSTSYQLNGAQTTDSGSYDVVVANDAGSVTSSPAVLSVVLPVILAGHITDAGTAAGLSGITVMLTNRTLVLSTNTDPTGYYVFTNLWPGSTNTVFALQSCETFLPALTNVVLGSTDNTAVDFVGLSNNVFSIQGQVTNGTAGLSGVSIQVTTTNGSQTIPTDAGGFYAFSRLCPGSYVLTPSAPGYEFVPASRSVALGPDLNAVNFTAVPVFTISGQVLSAGTGIGLSGVSVFINVTNHAQTDANGFFSSSNNPAGTYSLTPSFACYRFSPSTAQLVIGAGGPTATNFFATNNVYQLGGYVSAGTNGLNGLTVSLVGAGFTNSVTATNGTYLFSNLCPGTYTIEPLPFGCYQFSPPNHSVAAGPDNTTLDFVAYGAFGFSGQITLLATNPLPGVTIATLGTNSAIEAVTAADGSFSLAALCPGSYQITPALAGYRFSPRSLTLALGPDTNGLSFAASPVLSITNVLATHGPVQLAFPVLPGLVYYLNASSNLLDWVNLLTTNTADPSATQVGFSDPDATNLPIRFYRLGGDPAAATNAPGVLHLPAVSK